MKFDWDEKKNKSNFRKHGIKFEEAVNIFNNIVLTKIDDIEEHGEIREISIGEIQGIIIIVVVHTVRYNRIRIISARRANKNERRKYYEYIKNF